MPTEKSLVTDVPVKWAEIPLPSVLERLQTTRHGLSTVDAQRRLVEYGPNQLPEEEVNKLKVFLGFMWNPLSMEVAAVLSIVLLDISDFCLIIFLLLLNATIGFIEEMQAGAAVASLRSHLAPEAKALRDGKMVNVPASQLVPGDVIRVRLGDVIPADLKFLEGDPIKVDQSSLTGESLPVTKEVGYEGYSGSVVKQGETEAVVTCTGAHTFLGRAAQQIASAESHGRLQQVLSTVGNFCLVSIVLWCVIELIVQMGSRSSQNPCFLVTDGCLGVANILVLIVGGIPVAMPTVLSVTLAIGSSALAKENAIVTRLTCIEETASMEILCSDKTGTLTLNQLSVDMANIVTYNNASEYDVLKYAALAARVENNEAIDTVCFNSFKDKDTLKDAFTLLHYTPFDPTTKITIAKLKDNETGEVFRACKGAPQIVLTLDTNAEALRDSVEGRINEFASRGFRGLGVAVDRSGDVPLDKCQWKMIGLLPLFDPPRHDTADTIRRATELGVTVKMVTGDQRAIAIETCRQLGMPTNILDTSFFNQASPPGVNLAQLIYGTDGFAQVFPEHKFEIVKHLQSLGKVVGMTGDGVNDAPALAQADIGVAVDDASDAARAAADIVLMSSGLSVIITAIWKSREIFLRMKNYAMYSIAMTVRVGFTFVILTVAWNWYFPTLLIVILAILNDVFASSITFGLWLTLSTVVLFYVVHDTHGFQTVGAENLCVSCTQHDCQSFFTASVKKCSKVGDANVCGELDGSVVKGASLVDVGSFRAATIDAYWAHYVDTFGSNATLFADLSNIHAHSLPGSVNPTALEGYDQFVYQYTIGESGAPFLGLKYDPYEAAQNDDERFIGHDLVALTNQVPFCDYVWSFSNPNSTWTKGYKHIDPGMERNEGVLRSLVYVQVSISGQALIFVTRTSTWWFANRPCNMLLLAFILAQVVASVIGAVGFRGYPVDRIAVIGCGGCRIPIGLISRLFVDHVLECSSEPFEQRRSMSLLALKTSVKPFDENQREQYVTYKVRTNQHDPTDCVSMHIRHFEHGNGEEWLMWRKQFEYIRHLKQRQEPAELYQNIRILLRGAALVRFEAVNDSRPASKIRQHLRETPKPADMTIEEYVARIHQINDLITFLPPPNSRLVDHELREIVEANVPRSWQKRSHDTSERRARHNRPQESHYMDIDTGESCYNIDVEPVLTNSKSRATPAPPLADKEPVTTELLVSIPLGEGKTRLVRALADFGSPREGSSKPLEHLRCASSEFTTNRVINHNEFVTASSAPIRGYDMILGRELILKLQMRFDFGRRTMEWDELEVPMRHRIDLNAERQVYEISSSVDKAERRMIDILDAKYRKVTVNECVPTHLTEDEQAALRQLLLEFDDLNEGTIGTMPGEPYSFNLKEGVRPFHARPFGVPQAYLEPVKKEVERLERLGVIVRDARTPWAAPAFIIPKKDNTARFLTDFRRLNALIGKYRYLRLTMGICTAPDEFQRRMQLLLGDLPYVRVYLDDVLIITATNFQDHLAHVRTVCERFRASGLQINMRKSRFAALETEYLCYRLTPDEIQPLADKISAIQAISVPRTNRDLRRFIGLKWKRNKKKYGKLPATTPVVEPWKVVCVDQIGPYNHASSRKKYSAMTMIDPATGWFEVKAVTDKEAKTAAHILDNEWFCRYPRPEFCVYDQGCEFTGFEFQEMLESYGVKARPTTVKNPQANSILERPHQVLGAMVRTSNLDDNTWEQILPSVAFAIRATVSTTKEAIPGQLVFGRDMVLGTTFVANWKRIRERKLQQVQRDNARENNSRIDHRYNVGDWVLVLKDKGRLNKLEQPTEGPFAILQVHDNGTIVIQRAAYEETINIRRVAPYRPVVEADAEATVVLLNAGSTMTALLKERPAALKPSEQEPGLHTRFDAAVAAVNMLVQQKVCRARTVLVVALLALIFRAGESIETRNQLNEEQGEGEYSNVSVLSAIDTPTLHMCNVLKQLRPTADPAVKVDILDGLIVALDLLFRRTDNKKYEKRLLVITDAASRIHDASDVGSVVEMIQSMDVKLQIVGIDFTHSTENTVKKEEDGSDDVTVKTEEPPRTTPAEMADEIKVENEKMLVSVAREVNGEVQSASRRMQLLSQGMKKTVALVTKFRGNLEVGSDFGIPIFCYLKTKVATLPTLAKESQTSYEKETMGKVKMDRRYTNPQNPDEDVAPEEQVKAYRYGMEKVPFSSADVASAKFETEKSLKVLGFLDQHQLSHAKFIANTDIMIAEPGNLRAAQALCALVKAMAKMEQVAIARFVPRKNSAPRIVALIPHTPSKDTNYYCLWSQQLPYVEDVRNYEFAPLRTAKFTPNAKQQELADKLVDSLSVREDRADDVGMCFNPVLRRFFHAVEKRASDPDAPIPPLPSYVDTCLNMDLARQLKIKDVIQEFGDAFQLKEAVKKQGARKKKSFWSDVGPTDVKKEDADDKDNEQQDDNGGDGDDAGSDFDLDELLDGGDVTSVGSMNPISDFETLVDLGKKNRDRLTAAVTGMEAQVEMFFTSGNASFYPKALQCLQHFRKRSMELQYGSQFNDFLTRLKSALERTVHDAAWKAIERENLTLISNVEDPMVSTTPAQARTFLFGEEELKIEATAASLSSQVEEIANEDDMFAEFE
ncbi:TPA: hypothetical protein N0F65_011041 [Lagenidium giganteum]|uniref:P-type H(+)-exporting transporter n=1 Tax=Lagenidium giganteum TaxID=4803 RepID=A0AAV2ZBY0_9STRA|nr:TPA: hypothetical protein N0F65_011041 [Lagenidium giganteum]